MRSNGRSPNWTNSNPALLFKVITIFTIVLDGVPFIEKHLSIFNQLTIPWRWLVAEGSAGNTADTKWCQPQKPRRSQDGTVEYLESISDPRVKCVGMAGWKNKVDMVNTLLRYVTEPCVLLEVDADEIHTVENIEKIHRVLVDNPYGIHGIRMPCRYWVGPDLLCTGENCWSNRATEWERAWNYTPGVKFITHEPPNLPGPGRMIQRAEASRMGLCFDHMSYVTEDQVRYKEFFYKYDGLLENWKRLQDETEFPARLDEFFSFARPSPMVIRV